MRWRTKAKIQNAVSLLPPSLSYATYYWIQRRFGALRRMNPVTRLEAGIEIWKRIAELGIDPAGKVFFEVGTGRVPMAPLAYWLMGAERTVTVDLNPYLKPELIRESLEYITNRKGEIERLFGPLLQRDRLAELIVFHERYDYSTSAFLELTGIQYIAPGDAAHTQLEPNSIDFHTSYTVFEHIPGHVLESIVAEGNRIVKNDGLFVHKIDYSDHFAHSDPSISAINFLQYSDEQWERIAGNRYMYMNRLRHDDYLALFDSAGHRILLNRRRVDQQAAGLLESRSLNLHDAFRFKPRDVLAVTGAWIVSQQATACESSLVCGERIDEDCLVAVTT